MEVMSVLAWICDVLGGMVKLHDSEQYNVNFMEGKIKVTYVKLILHVCLSCRIDFMWWVSPCKIDSIRTPHVDSMVYEACSPCTINFTQKPHHEESILHKKTIYLCPWHPCSCDFIWLALHVKWILNKLDHHVVLTTMIRTANKKEKDVHTPHNDNANFTRKKSCWINFAYVAVM